ncbi:MAG: TetR/AcrR family transcriptional regulator, partial [Reyranella sp.]|nr:TetR/AcrR family transcriptional regulator [Reyranella sp.]
GYDATTIRRIADRVGVSAPALYLYFPDKEQMMLALCDQTFGHLLRAVEEIEKTVTDPRQRIRRFGEAYLKFGLEHPDEYRLIFMGNNVPESVRKVGHRMPIDDPTRPGVGGALVFQRLVAAFVEAEASGLALNYAPDTCAELCWMGIHGVVSVLITKPDFPWTNRDTLMNGMLDIPLKGVVAGG